MSWLTDFIDGTFGSSLGTSSWVPDLSSTPIPTSSVGGGDTTPKIEPQTGGGSSFWDAVPTLGAGILGTVGNYYTQQSAQDAATKQAELEHQRKLELLKLQLAAGGGGGGGGGSALAAAKIAALRAAYADAIQATLQGGELKQNALNNFIGGVQRPYLGK